MKCVKCGREHRNRTNEMCHLCFSDLQEARKNSDKRKHEIKIRRRKMKRFGL